MLVVDRDGEPLAPLRALEEILLCLGTWEDDDRRDPSAGTEPLPVPPPLADRVALAAVQRLLTALAPTRSRGLGSGRLLAPDGRYEHAPMTALILPAADMDHLSATAAALGHPGLDADIGELVDAHAEQLAGGCRSGDRTDLVSLLHGWPACSTSPQPTTPDCSPPDCGPHRPAPTACSSTPRKPPTPAPPTA
ncbi:hypothetical protein ABC795_04015 [Blastococcus sp. HT6-30]|uniref:hypothetical protein n=1 Tax=Blastococcus sp. HT6-30 TaxID=3144843 RepID=UPI00321A888E